MLVKCISKKFDNAFFSVAFKWQNFTDEISNIWTFYKQAFHSILKTNEDVICWRDSSYKKNHFHPFKLCLLLHALHMGLWEH